MPPSRLPLATLGVIGGGQLARMMVPAATDLGCDVVVLDPTRDSPAGQLAARQIVAPFDDAEALRALAESCDVMTYDIETIDTHSLAALVERGHRMLPHVSTLATIQDKLQQKERLAAAGLATSPFEAVDAPDAAALAGFGLPLVQKARRGGYDGRGVAVFTDVVVAERVLPEPSLAERFVDFERELAVMVARSRSGEIRTYPVVEMVVDPRANVLELLLAPARVTEPVAARACELAVGAIEAFDGIGVFGVELFETRAGDVLINEVAPRTHNSGHWTIEACRTSQFEQHVRAVLGLPLGDTTQHSPAAMLNLLGPAGASGPAWIDGVTDALRRPGVSLHLYGKHEVRAYRKMGHVTVTAESTDTALEIAREVRHSLQITGAPTA